MFRSLISTPFPKQLKLFHHQKLFNFRNLFPSSCLFELSTKVTSNNDTPPHTSNLIHHLERTSLVDFDNAEAVSRLNEAINFAQLLTQVNTKGVEPLVTVLENETLYLREDNTEDCCRKDVMRNASVTEEDYFVAPPGNVPLEPSSSDALAVTLTSASAKSQQ